MFHRHNWVKIKETYAEPLADLEVKRVRGRKALETVKQASFGVTTILWECSICQKLRKEEMLGKEKDA